MTTPTTTDRLADVLDCDREAAADLFDSLAGCTIPLNFGKRTIGGERSELAEAFAHHRIAAIQSQQAEIERKDEALESIANRDWVDAALDPQWLCDTARAALNPQPSEDTAHD